MNKSINIYYKSIRVFVTFFLFLILLLLENVTAQNLLNKTWSTGNPFHTNVFVENFGQFDNWAKTPATIKYAINNSDKIFFTQNGLTFKLIKYENISEKEREKIEKETGKEPIPKNEVYFVIWNGKEQILM